MVNTEASAVNSFLASADTNKQSRRLKARPLALTDLLLDDRSDARSESTFAGTQSSSTDNSARSSPLHCLPPLPGLPHPESELMTPSELLPSLGSALHASGRCKPCGWFWKPGGCQNGSQCFHCHLCPRDAMKLQRRVKREAARLRPSSQMSDKGEVKHSQIASHKAGPPPPPLSSPMLSVDLDNMDLPSPPSHPPLLAREQQALPQEQQEQQDLPSPPSHSPLLAREQQALPSIGALLHDTGKCRPCAFFHREQGCLNGKECNHCHACPAEELKVRKMEKIVARKAKQGVEAGLTIKQQAATPQMLNLSSLL